MPARLLIDSKAGQNEFWIQHPVVRVGSEVNCDVRLNGPVLPGHALTLEFRNGIYRVHNRTDESIILGSKVLAPGEASIWDSGDELRLDESTYVTLQCEVDPAPAPAPNDHGPSLVIDYPDSYDESVEDVSKDSEPEQTAQEGAKSAIDSTTVIQMVVTTFCLLGVVLILLAKMSMSETQTTREEVPTVSKLTSLASTTRQEARLVRRLQHAELAHLRGQNELALNEFAAIRDELARGGQLSDSGSEVSEVNAKMRMFLQDRLASLSD